MAAIVCNGHWSLSVENAARFSTLRSLGIPLSLWERAGVRVAGHPRLQPVGLRYAQRQPTRASIRVIPRTEGLDEGVAQDVEESL